MDNISKKLFALKSVMNVKEKFDNISICYKCYFGFLCFSIYDCNLKN